MEIIRSWTSDPCVFMPDQLRPVYQQLGVAGGVRAEWCATPGVLQEYVHRRVHGDQQITCWRLTTSLDGGRTFLPITSPNTCPRRDRPAFDFREQVSADAYVAPIAHYWTFSPRTHARHFFLGAFLAAPLAAQPPTRPSPLVDRAPDRAGRCTDGRRQPTPEAIRASGCSARCCR